MCLRLIAVLLLSSLIFPSCFTRWVMSEKEVKQHYADREVKPTFFTIRNDSIELFCATTGIDTLPPLLLIHGAPGGWFSGIGILDDPDLQKKFHIIAVDRIGYGKSKYKKRRKPVTSIEMQATAIHESLRLNRSFKPAVVYGTSYGAPIAARMITRYPGDFSHLVMVGGAIDPEQEKFWWFHRYANGLFVRLAMPRFINTASAEKFAHISELQKILPFWKDIRVPVTVIHGSEDNIVPVTNLDFARTQLKGTKAIFILAEGSGHLVRRSNPQLIKHILMQIAAER